MQRRRMILGSGFIARRVTGIGAALTSALLLVWSYPDYGAPLLAWFAFVPLLLAIDGQHARDAFLIGLVTGFAANSGIFFWMYEVAGFRPLHGVLLGTYLGLYTAYWCLMLNMFRWNSPAFPLLGAAAWVLTEYLLGNAGFLAFPWATLARTQHGSLPIVQVAAIAGEYGVSFLVMLSNVAIAQAIRQWRWRPVVIAVAAITTIYAWGQWRLGVESPAPVTRVAVIQPALELRAPGTGPGTHEALGALEELSLQAARAGAEVIIWPEAVIHDWRANPAIMERVVALAKGTGANFLIGVSENEKFLQRTADGSPVKPNRHNSAVLISSDGNPSLPYHKNLLVPFSEYLPLEGLLTWPDWLVADILPLQPGEGYRAFALPNGVSLVPVICWENLFAEFVRRAMPNSPRLLAHLVNDNWFGYSPASAQHNAASVFRAVENATPVIVASNTGPSVIFDSRGRMLDAVHGLFEPGVAMADISAGSDSTFYTRHGEVFTFICALWVATVLAGRLLDMRLLGRLGS